MSDDPEALAAKMADASVVLAKLRNPMCEECEPHHRELLKLSHWDELTKLTPEMRTVDFDLKRRREREWISAHRTSCSGVSTQ
jgi:hypothetical protein